MSPSTKKPTKTKERKSAGSQKTLAKKETNQSPKNKTAGEQSLVADVWVTNNAGEAETLKAEKNVAVADAHSTFIETIRTSWNTGEQMTKALEATPRSNSVNGQKQLLTKLVDVLLHRGKIDDEKKNRLVLMDKTSLGFNGLGPSVDDLDNKPLNEPETNPPSEWSFVCWPLIPTTAKELFDIVNALSIPDYLQLRSEFVDRLILSLNKKIKGKENKVNNHKWKRLTAAESKAVGFQLNTLLATSTQNYEMDNPLLNDMILVINNVVKMLRADVTNSSTDMAVSLIKKENETEGMEDLANDKKASKKKKEKSVQILWIPETSRVGSLVSIGDRYKGSLVGEEILYRDSVGKLTKEGEKKYEYTVSFRKVDENGKPMKGNQEYSFDVPGKYLYKKVE